MIVAFFLAKAVQPPIARSQYPHCKSVQNHFRHPPPPIASAMVRYWPLQVRRAAERFVPVKNAAVFYLLRSHLGLGISRETASKTSSELAAWFTVRETLGVGARRPWCESCVGSQLPSQQKAPPHREAQTRCLSNAVPFLAGLCYPCAPLAPKLSTGHRIFKEHSLPLVVKPTKQPNYRISIVATIPIMRGSILLHVGCTISLDEHRTRWSTTPPPFPPLFPTFSSANFSSLPL